MCGLFSSGCRRTGSVAVGVVGAAAGAAAPAEALHCGGRGALPSLASGEARARSACCPRAVLFSSDSSPGPILLARARVEMDASATVCWLLIEVCAGSSKTRLAL